MSGASRLDPDFLKPGNCGLACFASVHFQRLDQRGTKVFHEFVSRFALAVYARDFLDPTDPPSTVLLYDCGVFVFHASILLLRSSAAQRSNLSAAELCINGDPVTPTGKVD